jgi:hypothetical protein
MPPRHPTDPALPQTLAATPRQVHLRPGLRKKPQEHGLAFFLILPHLWIGIAAALYFLFQISLPLFGHTIEGRVTKLDPWRSSRSPGYNVAYEYHDGGRTYAGNDTTSSQAGSRLAVGSPVKVKAIHIAGLTNDCLPEIGTFLDFERLIFLGVWVVVWNAGLAMIFHNSYVLPRRRRRVLADGIVTRGVIQRVQQIGPKSNPKHQATYAYPLGDGQVLEGKATLPRFIDNDQPPPTEGGTVTVFYSPTNPRHRVALELSPYTVAPTDADAG